MLSKLFTVATFSVRVFADVEPGELEAAVQAWLRDNPTAHVTQMAQSQNVAGLATLTVLYVRR